jgi:hypothetical protein
MRKSMPAKRYLLIAAVFVVALLSAKATFWVHGSVYNFRTSASELLTGYKVNKVAYVPLGKSTLELENRFVYTDGKQPDRQEQLYDMVNLSLYRNWSNAFAKVFLRTELIDKSYGEITPPGQFFPFHERNFRQAGASGKLKLGPVDTALNVRYRYFDFTNVYSFTDKEVSGENVRGDVEASMEVIKPVSVFVSAYKKSSLEDKFNSYDLSTAGTGLRLYLPLSSMEHITGQTSVEWRDSNVIANDGSERMIPLYHNLRYSRMITPDIAGFINYENRSFYDRERQSFLFNSQFLRASCKYTLPYDQSLGSFVEIGGKLAPQDKLWHKSSGLMGKTEMRVYDKLYLGSVVTLMPQRQHHYEALARYFFAPFSEVFIGYTYIDDPEYADLAKYITGGCRIMF